MNSGEGRNDLAKPGTLLWEINRLAQRVNNIVMFGLVFQADYINGKVQVQTVSQDDDSDVKIVTDWIPWITRRAGKNYTWEAPEIGEQVMVISPNGNLVNAVAAFSLNCADNPHVAQSADIDKEVWIDQTNAYLEFNRQTWLRMFYIRPEGAYSWRVGTQAEIYMDKTRIEARVMNTRFVVQDGKVGIYVNGQQVSQEWTVNDIFAQVAGQTFHQLTPDKVQASVKGTGMHVVEGDTVTSNVKNLGVTTVKEDKIQHTVVTAPVVNTETGQPDTLPGGFASSEGVLTVESDQVEAQVNKNGYIRVQDQEVSMELVQQQVRSVLTPTFVGQLMKEAVMAIMPDPQALGSVLAQILVPGSTTIWKWAEIFTETLAETGLLGSAPGAVYSPGAAVQYTAPAESGTPNTAPTPPDPVELPQPTTGNKPGYPRGDKFNQVQLADGGDPQPQAPATGDLSTGGNSTDPAVANSD